MACVNLNRKLIANFSHTRLCNPQVPAARLCLACWCFCTLPKDSFTGVTMPISSPRRNISWDTKNPHISSNNVPATSPNNFANILEASESLTKVKSPQSYRISCSTLYFPSLQTSKGTESRTHPKCKGDRSPTRFPWSKEVCSVQIENRGSCHFKNGFFHKKATGHSRPKAGFGE